MAFTVLGAVAELARSLIAERVRAGLRNARAKGKRLGRPRVIVDARRIAALRNSGASWATVCEETGLSKGTAQRAVCGLTPRRYAGAYGSLGADPSLGLNLGSRRAFC